jgi:putative ABC transport system permease protein
MVKNYLLVTFRNLLKNKVFTIINILGLGIALAVCIVAYFNHMFNYEFDRTHENFDKIYRVTSFRDMEGREQEYGIVPATLGIQIKKDIPGIEKTARLIKAGSSVKQGNDIFPMRISFVDPEFLDIFSFPLINGERKSFTDRGTAFISQTAANTLFGKEYPVGKTISIVNGNNREFSFTVGAVFTDLPVNSSFNIDVLLHIDNFLLSGGQNDADWKMFASAFFLMIPDRALLPSVIQSMKNYLPVQNRAREDFRINRFALVPLKDVGENTRNISSSGLVPSLHPAALKAPPVMAIFILLIACFNFANTSIATFSKRLKEIGLRKTFGGQRRQLVFQFMFETLIICSMALLAGIAFAEYLVPAYSSLWSYMSIEMTFTGHSYFLIFLILLLLLTGFIAGVYPALHVSSFSPANVLKGAAPFRGPGKLSAILLTMQFTISVTALVLGIVFAKNSDYQNTLDLGFDRNKLIMVPVPQAYFISFRNEVLTNSKVISAEGTQNHIGYGGYRRPVKDSEKQMEAEVLDIGPGYAQTMGLRLTEGRLFDESRSAADLTNGSVIVNSRLVRDFGWKEAVGRIITVYDTIKLTVIGVVEDFYNDGVWAKIEPTILRLTTPNRFGLLAVRAQPGDLPGVLDFLSSKWKGMSTNFAFGGRLQEDLMQEGKDVNNSILKVNLFLAIVATLLSLIGMFNMVSLDIIRRTKEMGIRKIQGASVPVLMFLSGKKFLIVLAIASVLGCAGGYYFSDLLLDSIWDYYVDISPGILIMSVLIMCTATIFTIIFKIARAAMKNPVDSLRYE